MVLFFRDEMMDALRQMHCAKLRRKFSIIKPAKTCVRIKIKQRFCFRALITCFCFRAQISWLNVFCFLLSIKTQSFTRELSDFMSCPYKSNTTEREVNRFVRLFLPLTDAFVQTEEAAEWWKLKHRNNLMPRIPVNVISQCTCEANELHCHVKPQT